MASPIVGDECRVILRNVLVDFGQMIRVEGERLLNLLARQVGIYLQQLLNRRRELSRDNERADGDPFISDDCSPASIAGLRTICG